MAQKNLLVHLPCRKPAFPPLHPRGFGMWSCAMILTSMPDWIGAPPRFPGVRHCLGAIQIEWLSPQKKEFGESQIWHLLGCCLAIMLKTHPRFVMKTNHWYGPYIRLISHTEDRWKIRTIHSMPAMIKTWFCWIMVIHPMPWESKHNGLYLNIG